MKKGYRIKLTIFLILLAAAIIAALFSFFRLFPGKQDNLAPHLDREALYWDSALPTAERVEDLLNRMSLTEKVGQMALERRTA